MKTPASMLPIFVLAYLVATIQAFWMEDIAHQGYAPYAADGYAVFRNVKDYGARGDGVTDDTQAINNAIADGNRCGQGCASSTTTPAVVYFPAGTYLLSSSILPFYLTQLVGDAANPPTLKAAGPGFTGQGLIDGDPYYASENLNWLATNVFYRQVRNFVIDTTAIPPGTAATGIHWPTAQATSLQNVRFNMPTAPGVAHVGLFIESGGSGGFMSDLTFVGGASGASLGNQQFTMRNLVFENCVTAITQLWDWGWTYAGLRITDCTTGINITAGGPSAQQVGSITVLDSQFTNVDTALLTAYEVGVSRPAAAGSVILENVVADNVGAVVAASSTGQVLLAGSPGASLTVAAWGQGNRYVPTGPTAFQNAFLGAVRPPSLLASSGGHSNHTCTCGDHGTHSHNDNSKAGGGGGGGGVPGAYYARSKPQYEELGVGNFVSVRAAGACGDGHTDDTAALQAAINNATQTNRVVYIDYGLYLVTVPLVVPPGARIVGEAYPMLLAGGSAAFADAAHPQALLRVGAYSGQAGTVELSDLVLATQGAQPGAVLLEWNLAAPAGKPAGLWDVHTRIGGFTGSGLQVAQCAKTPDVDSSRAGGGVAVNGNCIAAFMSMHVTASAANLYAENVWLWTADHDIDDQANTQITVYAGRGLYIEATAGTIWLVGTAVEHHTLYQYQLDGTQNVYMGQVQTETPYYQPNPGAAAPFEANATYNDPDFAASCAGVPGNCAMAWGLRVLDSDNVLVYGAGLYSFFDNYGQSCIANGQSCQARITSLEGSTSGVCIYNLNTVGAQSMLTKDGAELASYADNVNVYPDTIALFQSG
ncbi:Pectin lyase fold protein [Niveomyces insectorum RCEF 264]|uniref:Pectin lyase fold protein n=1 Tax=Niveomyces insectorum RCEF 264 TaxID=1081102 RepID=A0A168A522_9HYPO|nr:Pectin lyase fold protein [Niveomyces insectorum RCEF 264]